LAHRHGEGLVVAHATAVKDVPRVLAPVKEEGSSGPFSIETSRKWRGSRYFMVNCYWRVVVVRWRSSRIEAMRMMSSM
jgi:hypothetical protein